MFFWIAGVHVNRGIDFNVNTAFDVRKILRKCQEILESRTENRLF
jgi:hypothetical protein